MRKIITLTVAVLFGISNLEAQQQDTKRKNYYEVPKTIQRDGFELSFKHIVGKYNLLKFGMVINNQSEDYIVFNNQEGRIQYNKNKGTTDKKDFFIFPPNKASSSTYAVKEDDGLLVEQFKFEIDKLYKVPSRGKVIQAPEFKLPAEKNNFTVGNFSVKLLKLRKKTDATTAKFHCTYNGDDFGIIRPNNTSVRVKEDKVFANDKRVKKQYLLKKGEKIAFTLSFHIEAKVVDMQFADMFVQWNDMFQESKKIPLKGETIEFFLNHDLTEEKNN